MLPGSKNAPQIWVQCVFSIALTERARSEPSSMTLPDHPKVRATYLSNSKTHTPFLFRQLDVD